MASPDVQPSVPQVSDGELVEIIEQISCRLRAGESIDLKEYASGDPERLERLEQMLPTLRALADLGHSTHDGPAPEQGETRSREDSRGALGDYRILREIGRGGMGVVYEAEQISLGRKVALKVLPFAAVLDQRQLKRFKNEAQAAAGLHHQNIVPVYGVGCERGVHYYAMQYIEGQTLAEVVRDLRRTDGLDKPPEDAEQPAASGLAESLASGRRLARADADHRTTDSTDGRQRRSASDGSSAASADTAKAVQAAISTDRSTRSPAYFRSIAQLGIQVAEALDHAHEEGVVHRDVKPSNLILDAGGKVWVTDFGLARVEADPGLTMTGDILGTLRYMSPEQATGKRAVVDHRADVYSLGVTLYELLTLQPAFPGNDRQELLRRIALEEPPAVRKLNKDVPADLETIVLKATAKTPDERYASAGDLAVDMKRFLDDVPIHARRPSLIQHAVKWGRRHRGLVTSAVVSMTVVLIFAVIALVVSTRQTIRARRAEASAYESLQAERQAQREKTELLWKSYLNEARARRHTRLPGHRFESLAALQKAADVLRSLDQFDEHSIELRNEAVACLPLVDVREVQRWGDPPSPQAFDANYQRYAKPNSQNEIGIHRLSDDRELFRIAPSALPYKFSPDGRYLVGWQWEQPKAPQCIVWDLTKREIVVNVPFFHKDSLDFSPDGQRISLGRREGTIHIYELPAGDEVQSLSIGRKPGCVDFHGDGRRLAVSLVDTRQVQIWNVDSGELLHTLTHPGGVSHFSRGVAWGPRGQLLAVSCFDRCVYVWDAETYQQVSVLRGHESEVIGVAFAHASDLLASRAWDSTVRLWDPRSGTQRLRLEGSFFHFGFSTNDRWLGFAEKNLGGPTGVWEAAHGRALQGFAAHPGVVEGVRGVDVSPDGRLLVSAGRDGIRLWDRATGRRLGSLTNEMSCSVCFHAGGEFIISSGASGLTQWPVHEDREADVFQVGPRRLLAKLSPSRRQQSCLSRDGTTAAAIAGPQEVVVVPLEQPSKKLLLRSDHDVCWVALSPQGRWIAVRCAGEIQVWDARQGKLSYRLPAETATHVAFTPQGKWLVAGGREEYCFWEVGSWRPDRRFPRKTHPPSDGLLAFTPDGSMMAVTKSRFLVQLVDPSTGVELATLEPPDPSTIYSLNFSDDGTLLAVGNLNGAIQLWDLRRVRRQLREMDLDWEPPPGATADQRKLTPLQVKIDPGDLGKDVEK